MAKKATAKRPSRSRTAKASAAAKARADAEESPEVRGAAEAVRMAKAELEKAEQLYQRVRQEAVEQLQKVREKTVGDLIDGTLEVVKKYPAAGLIVAGAVGFFLGRLLGRLFGK